MDDVVEARILSVLPYAKGWDRVDLIFGLRRVGGPQSLEVLVPIVDGTDRRPASERSAALQGLNAHATAAEHVDLYALALSDRDLFVQCLALGYLRRWDRTGLAAASVAAWVKRRLAGRARKKITDFTEVPLAVGYFADIDDLATLAILLARYDDQLERVERAVLEYMWPREQRQLWASGVEGGRPNLDGLGHLGHSMEFYLRFDAAVSGHEFDHQARIPTPEDEAAALRNHEIEFEALLVRLERRRDRAADS